MDDDHFALIDMLCRCQLLARRLGCHILVHDAPDAVRDALTTVGLADVLLTEDGIEGQADGSDARL